MAKTFICSDESVNVYGFRVLTDGIDIKNFKKNPIMLFNHERYSWGADTYNGPIGRWDNITKKDGVLYAEPVIDDEDPKGKIISNKVEKDFIRAASIGFRIISTSEDPKLLVPGQTRATVTKCELIEISIVDVPANKNALALFDENGQKMELNEDTFTILSLGTKQAELPTIHTEMKKVTLKAAWAGLLAFLSLTPQEGNDTVEHEFTEEQLQGLDGLATQVTDLTQKLKDAETSVTNLTNEKQTLSQKVSELEAELAKRPGGHPSNGGKPEEEKPETELNDKDKIVDHNASHYQLAASLGIKVQDV